MPLPEADEQPAMKATQVILHSAVDAPGPTSLFGYFSRADVTLESHFYVRLDGRVEQYVDTSRTADANRTANARAISIETEDDGNPDQRPWTAEQIEALVRLVDWCCRTHGIPRRKAPAHDEPGIGWHSQWGAPSPWTPVAGKTCPGAARIEQVPELLRRVDALDDPKPSASPIGDDDMQWFVVKGRTRADRWVTNWCYKVPLGGKVGATLDAQVEHKALLRWFHVVDLGRGLDANGNAITVEQRQIDAVPPIS
jgi:hypothetical protein